MEGVIFEVVTSQPRRALDVLRPVAGADRVQLFGDRLHVRADGEDGRDRLVAALDHADQGDATVRRIVPSLEDIFIELLASSRVAAAAPSSAAQDASIQGRKP
jgi:hypothetical protein